MLNWTRKTAIENLLRHVAANQVLVPRSAAITHMAAIAGRMNHVVSVPAVRDLKDLMPQNLTVKDRLAPMDHAVKDPIVRLTVRVPMHQDLMHHAAMPLGVIVHVRRALMVHVLKDLTVRVRIVRILIVHVVMHQDQIVHAVMRLGVIVRVHRVLKDRMRQDRIVHARTAHVQMRRVAMPLGVIVPAHRALMVHVLKDQIVPALRALKVRMHQDLLRSLLVQKSLAVSLLPSRKAQDPAVFLKNRKAKNSG